MRAAKRIALLVYLLACAFAVGSLACAHVGPYADRFADLLGMRPYRVAVGICLVVVAVHLAITLGRVLFSPRPAHDYVYPDGSVAVEVTVRALEASVRFAVEETGELMVEDVSARTRGKHARDALFAVAVVPLVDEGLAEVASRAQERAQAACERLVGVPVAEVRVKLLPHRTTVVRKEIQP